MSRQPIPRLVHSLWDRLTAPGPPPGSGVGPPSSGEVERIKDSVRRDLEWLLNAKRPPVDIPDGLASLDPSLMTYGLPDITSLSPGDFHELERFRRTLERVIRHFEPRLAQVRVAFSPLDRDDRRSSLHYRIDAMLRLDPLSEPIVFDTILDLGSRAFSVRREGT